MDKGDEWGQDSVTPVARVCPDCAGEQIVLANFVPAPKDIREAWAISRCCGTKDEANWRWCFTLGVVSWPSKADRESFDRRKAPR